MPPFLEGSARGSDDRKGFLLRAGSLPQARLRVHLSRRHHAALAVPRLPRRQGIRMNEFPFCAPRVQQLQRGAKLSRLESVVPIRICDIGSTRCNRLIDRIASNRIATHISYTQHHWLLSGRAAVACGGLRVRHLSREEVEARARGGAAAGAGQRVARNVHALNVSARLLDCRASPGPAGSEALACAPMSTLTLTLHSQLHAFVKFLELFTILFS